LELDWRSGDALPTGSVKGAPVMWFPIWDVLRGVGGEIAEIVAYTDADEATPALPVLLAGRFERGGLLQVTLVPQQAHARWRLTIGGTRGEEELTLSQGWSGPAHLKWRDGTGVTHEDAWSGCDPCAALVAAFESAVVSSVSQPSVPGRPSAPMTGFKPTWQDAIRSLELDDAARRSIERRRATALEYQEATEEASFKGTMTLVGCGLLWGMLVLLILSAWLPRLGWFIVPLLIGFLAMQLLRWIVPKPQSKT
jgi:hypothetical protein